MLSTSFLSISLGILIIIIFLPALFSVKQFQHALEQFFDKENNVRIVAFLDLFIGFFILAQERRITLAWTGLMTVIGWLALIKGIIALWWPKFHQNLSVKFFNASETFVILFSFLNLLIGLGFVYLGMFVL